MATIDRRQMLRALGAVPVAAAAFAWKGDEVSAANGLAQAARAATAPATPFAPRFFTAHEWESVRALVDAIIPRDDRSGSATDAGVPELLDFLMIDEPHLAEESSRQTAMRGGLAWIDLECQQRFDKSFVACTEAERIVVLDDISQPPPATEPALQGPDDAPRVPVLAHGRAFFASFRDLTATGFWTTKMGIADLQYTGNRFVASWEGCPADALEKLGVTYPRG